VLWQPKPSKALPQAGTHGLYAHFSFANGIPSGLKQEAAKGIIPSYRTVLPHEVISGLTITAKTSGKFIFCRRSAKPSGKVKWLKPHTLDVPASGGFSFRTTGYQWGRVGAPRLGFLSGELGGGVLPAGSVSRTCNWLIQAPHWAQSLLKKKTKTRLLSNKRNLGKSHLTKGT